MEGRLKKEVVYFIGKCIPDVDTDEYDGNCGNKNGAENGDYVDDGLGGTPRWLTRWSRRFKYHIHCNHPTKGNTLIINHLNVIKMNNGVKK